MTRKFDIGRFAALFDMNGKATPAVWSDFLLALRRAIESALKAQKLYTHTTLSKGGPNLFWCDTSQAAFTVTLPAAAEVPDEEYVFVKVSSGANSVTIDGYASETINGVSTNTELLAEHDTLAVRSNGEEYYVTFRATGLTTGDHGVLAGLGDDDHAHYLKEEASGGVASEVPDHTHASAAECGTIAHSVTTGQTADDHHAQAHTLASHSTKAHNELTGIGANDHHAQTHAASHSHNGADEVVVENLDTAGATGTVPIAQADGSLAMGAPAPAAHALGGALHGADTLANLSAKVSDDDVCGLVATQQLDNKTLSATAAAADGTALGATGVRFDMYARDVHELRSTHGSRVVYLGPAAAGVYTTLQAAINALPATGGLVYVLPVYTESSAVQIVPKANVAIICPTRDAVITDTVGTMTTGFFATYTGTTGIDNVTLYGLNFVESGAGVTSAGILARYAPENWIIEECSFTNFQNGIIGYQATGWNGFVNTKIRRCVFTNCISVAVFATGFNNVVIEECRAYGGGTGDFGFVVTGAAKNVTLRGCYATNMEYDGFRAHSYWEIRGNITFENCISFDNNRWGFCIFGYTGLLVFPFILRGCTAELNSQHGFYFYGTGGMDGRAICTNCVAIDNSYGTANGYSGFYLASTCERVELIGCQGYKKNYAEQKYGFEVQAGADKCEIRGGVWSPNQTGVWLDNGTATIIDARND